MEALHPDDHDKVKQAYFDLLSAREPWQFEHRLLMPDGRVKVVLESGQTYFADDGTALRAVGTAQDISSLRHLETQMHLLGVAFQHSGEAILISDQQNRIVTVNPAFTDLTGYSLAESVGKNPGFLSAGRSSPEDYAAMWEEVHRKGFWQGEIWDRRKDGAIYPKWMSISVIHDDDGEIRYHIAHFTDISAERASEEKLHHMAHHDSLTGLPNRLSLAGRIDQALAQARRDNGRVALLFIDLDRFKSVNDTLGHHIGDLLLIEVAQRLLGSVRDSDVVSRLGGDEFVIMLTGIEHTTAIATVAEKIVDTVGAPYVIDGHDLYTSPSIGISIFPTDGDNSVALLKNADAAMYHAKSAGRNNFQFFDAKMNEAAVERLKIEHGLRHALANDEFCLYYQPIIEISSGRVIEVEALVRWLHPEEGMIAPGRFIGIAEETGLIQPLGEWVFWTACRQLADFNAAGIDVKMGINISAMQMRNGNLPILARGAIEALGLKPQNLIFEITESVAMQHPQDTVAILDHLHDMGVLLAIDDFGTGYSSLSYLKMFPIDHLKLDRSFVDEIGRGEDSTAICDATIGLAHNLGLKLVAEGVETQEQFDYLRQGGCDLVQGFFFSRPVPVAEIIDFIRQRNAC
jgi:diguanylate cyclase (GGDEF)-like protein/PAS domain S-box-containing protein